MIKLIVTDLDGTLLNDKKQLPHNFKEIFYALKSKGIILAVASGRSYSGVEHIFKDMATDMFFICDNGAFTMEKGKMADIQLIDKSSVHKVLDCVAKLGNVDALICGKKGTYYSYCSKKMQDNITTFYTNTIFTEDLYSIDDDIFKISICDFYSPAENAYPYMDKQLGQQLSIYIAGNIWVDVMAKGIDKGLGVQKLQEKLGITKAETMVFGDFDNDLPMLKNAGFAFVMENARDDIKLHATHIAKSCNQEGVTIAIEEFILKM